MVLILTKNGSSYTPLDLYLKRHQDQIDADLVKFLVEHGAKTSQKNSINILNSMGIKI